MMEDMMKQFMKNMTTEDKQKMMNEFMAGMSQEEKMGMMEQMMPQMMGMMGDFSESHCKKMMKEMSPEIREKCRTMMATCLKMLEEP